MMRRSLQHAAHDHASLPRLALDAHLLVSPSPRALLAPLLDRAVPVAVCRAPESGSTVVLARDGTPLRAFADSDGVWRYPTTASRYRRCISPRC